MLVTLQLYNDGQWQDGFQLQLLSPELGRRSPVRIEVVRDYAVRYFGEKHSLSYTAMQEVNPMDIARYDSWPALLDDIIPTGYARARWLESLGLLDATESEQALGLLTRAAISPIGNIRVKESLSNISADTDSSLESVRFSQSDVVERDHDFLSYAQSRGALSGGATGAGGVAPKLLIRMNASREVWIDALQDDISADTHYLVKFPSGKESIHQDILRAEGAYYRLLDEWLQMNTIDTSAMLLIEGQRHPSLWLPRFDRQCQQTAHGSLVKRYGVESVYSLMNRSAGSLLRHEDVLATLASVCSTADKQALALEYLKRDLLNVIFGNTDNHGRNVAVIKTASSTELAPIFDFAPMKADPEQIIRTTKWSQPFERGAEFEWLALCDALSDYGEPGFFKQELCQFAERLSDLPRQSITFGVPTNIRDFPTIQLARTPEKLQRWGLIS